jgi:hypothetical protein
MEIPREVRLNLLIKLAVTKASAWASWPGWENATVLQRAKTPTTEVLYLTIETQAKRIKASNVHISTDIIYRSYFRK